MNNNDKNSNKNKRDKLTSGDCPGDRLKKCREKRGYTQQRLAESLPKDNGIIKGYTNNYISMLERGERDINEKLADMIGKELNIAPDYLLCRTNTMYPYEHTIYSNTKYIAMDYALLSYLSFTKNIIFCIEDSDENSNNEKRIRIDQICNIDFSKPTCVYAINKNVGKECRVNAIVKSVIIDGNKYSYGQFVFIINEIKRDISYKINSMSDILDSFKFVSQIDFLADDMLKHKALYEIMPEKIMKE